MAKLRNERLNDLRTNRLANLYLGTAKESIIVVENVVELEAAVAVLTEGQFVYMKEGVYQLTEQLVIPLLANKGGIISDEPVEILGDDEADSAILIQPTDAAGTFEFSLLGNIGIKGGVNKIGLKVTNVEVDQKTIIYVKGSVHFEDNGTGKGLTIANTGTGAMRLYVSCLEGTGWDSVDITNKNADDKWHFRGINFDTIFVASIVNIADEWFFQNCKIAHAGMTGGHASNVVNVVGSYTIEATAVAAVNAADFPGAFNPAIV